MVWLLSWFSVAKVTAYQRLYGIENLSSSLITSICQDSCGYIWIGTDYGLNRFDGVYFTQYHSDGVEGLKWDGVECVLPDSDGNIWVAMYSSVQLYSTKEDRFHDVTFKDCDKIACRDMLMTPDGDVWLMISGSGIWCINRETMIASPIEKINRSVGNTTMRSMKLDRKGRLWIHTTQGSLLCYDTHSGETHRYIIGSDIPGSIVGVMEGPDGEIAVATHNNGIFVLDENTGYWTMFCDAPDMTIMSVFDNNRGDMFLGTDTHGMWRVDLKRKCIVSIYQLAGGKNLPKTTVSAFCEDKDGNAWIGFHKSGLFFFSSQEESFTYIDISQIGGDNGRSILAAYSAGNGNMLLCQEGNGIAEVTREGELHNRWLQGRGFASLLHVDDDRLWIGGYSRGAGLLDLRTGKVDWIAALRNGAYVKSIARDHEGNLYLAIPGRGILSLTPDGKTVRTLCGGQMKLYNDWFNILFIDSRGLLWITHFNGFDIYDPGQDRMLELDLRSGLRSSSVYAIVEAHDGLMWIGTNNGLFSYDFTKCIWKHYGKDEGLLNERICGIVEGNDGCLWVSTYKGLFRLDTKTEHFTAFYRGNGLKFDNYTYSIYGSLPAGFVYFGNDSGVTLFNPSEVRINDFSRGITLTGVFLSGQRIATDSDGNIRLDYSDNTFTLRFSTMDFRKVENICYEYCFTDEPDAEWHRTSVGISEITFSHFVSGHHVLQVRAREGNVVSEVKQIDIYIIPPWWRSWWAYVIYCFAGVVVIILAFDAYMNRRLAKNNESEIRFLIDVGHELRSPLTLIKSPLDILLKHDYDEPTNRALYNMKRNTNRMLKLVDQILSIRRIEKGQMKLHYAETDMADYVGDVCSDYSYEAEIRSLKLTCMAENDGIKVWLDRDNFDKVVNNLLANAMKYVSGGGEIAVHLRSDAENCYLTVTDNGPGIDEQQLKNVFNRFYRISSLTASDQTGYGIGLDLTYKLVKLHGGDIVARNRTDGVHGSEFVITLPLGKSHLPKDCIVGDGYFVNKGISEAVRPSAGMLADGKKHRKTNRHTGYKVVVVDDDEEIRNYLKEELGEFYHVSVYTNGHEALEAVTDCLPDLVISDVKMPEMDGITLLSCIKNNTRTSHIPVVLLTTKVEHQFRVEGLETGADAYIDKPFNLEELEACIAGLLANRNLLRGKYSGMQEQEENIIPVELKGNNALLMEKIMKAVNERLSDSEFKVDALAVAVGLSRVQLHRRVKEITGLTVGGFIRNLRMQQAAKLFEKGDVTVSQVTYAVGMSNPNHFAISFKKYFGVSPSDYMAKHRNSEKANETKSDSDETKLK